MSIRLLTLHVFFFPRTCCGQFRKPPVRTHSSIKWPLSVHYQSSGVKYLMAAIRHAIRNTRTSFCLYCWSTLSMHRLHSSDVSVCSLVLVYILLESLTQSIDSTHTFLMDLKNYHSIVCMCTYYLVSLVVDRLSSREEDEGVGCELKNIKL